jgi:hypothetical protein
MKVYVVIALFIALSIALFVHIESNVAGTRLKLTHGLFCFEHKEAVFKDRSVCSYVADVLNEKDPYVKWYCE